MVICYRGAAVYERGDKYPNIDGGAICKCAYYRSRNAIARFVNTEVLGRSIRLDRTRSSAIAEVKKEEIVNSPLYSQIRELNAQRDSARESPPSTRCYLLPNTHLSTDRPASLFWVDLLDVK